MEEKLDYDKLWIERFIEVKYDVSWPLGGTTC